MAVESTIGGMGTLFVGEDKILRFELFDENDPAAAIDMTGWSMLFDIRKKDTSEEFIISVVITTLIGIFDPVRALNTQRAIVSLTDDQLNLFRANNYRWSWKRMDNGTETVLGYGTFAPQKATAP